MSNVKPFEVGSEVCLSACPKIRYTVVAAREHEYGEPPYAYTLETLDGRTAYWPHSCLKPAAPLSDAALTVIERLKKQGADLRTINTLASAYF